MSSNTVYVVTGANRGIGLGLVGALLQRANTTVIGTARNSTAVDMIPKDLPRGENSVLHTVELDYGLTVDPEAIKRCFTSAVPDLDKVDILISNAGFSPPMTGVLDTSAQELRDSIEINTIAPLSTFQALWPFMKTSETKLFAYISSSVGSMGMMEPMPGGAYGPSKAAGNWIAKALHVQLQSQGLTSVALHPGFVKTNMGKAAAAQWGMQAGPPDEVADSVKGILAVLDQKDIGGRFLTQNGVEMDW